LVSVVPAKSRVPRCVWRLANSHGVGDPGREEKSLTRFHRRIGGIVVSWILRDLETNDEDGET
jgi:hypothetical protein